MTKSLFSSLKYTKFFMIGFGLLMGIVFPFYSYLFFGTGAFSPLYVVGCLTAGLMVGMFCYWAIRQVMSHNLAKQRDLLSQLMPIEQFQDDSDADQLETMTAANSLLISKTSQLIDKMRDLTNQIAPLCQSLEGSAVVLIDGNNNHVTEMEQAIAATNKIDGAFATFVNSMQEMSERFKQRTILLAKADDSAAHLNQQVRSFSQDVEANSSHLNQMAGDIDSLTSSFDNLTTSFDQATNSIKEISNSVNAAKEASQYSAIASNRVKERADAGIKQIIDLDKDFAHITNNSRTSTASINRLADMGEKIDSIVLVLQNIAKKTNLLSLNASIIAADAGEHGRAFSVVADQVGELARLASSSTTEIGSLVTGVQSEIGTVRLAIGEGDQFIQASSVKFQRTRDVFQQINDQAIQSAEIADNLAETGMKLAQETGAINSEIEKEKEQLRAARKSLQLQKKSSAELADSASRLHSLASTMSGEIANLSDSNHQILDIARLDENSLMEMHSQATKQKLESQGLCERICDTGVLIRANAQKADGIGQDIVTIAKITDKLEKEVTNFSSSTTDDTGEEI